MSPESRPEQSREATAPGASRRGRGGELWLLRAGPPEERDAALALFAAEPPESAWTPPGGDEEPWARAFAERLGIPLERREDLRSTASTDAPGIWNRLEARLALGPARLVVVLPAGVLQAVVARALSLGPAAAEALRVDPGRGVCLRDEAIGVVLRRSNARGPTAESGMALPGGRMELPR